MRLDRRAVGCEQDGVAVRRGVDHRLGADAAAGAGAGFDHHRLADGLGEPKADQARGGFGAAAGREGYDEMNRPAGVI